MIRNGSPTESASHRLGAGVPVTGDEDVNPPKGQWLFNTEHFCVS